MKDFIHEAMEYRDIDLAIAAKLEAESARQYRQLRGTWPELMSRRAWQYACETWPEETHCQYDREDV